MRSQHIWTEKDRQGKKREVRATKFGGVWRFQSKFSGEEQWTYYDSPPPEDLLKLRDIIERKYRRRRASADDVASVDKLVRDLDRGDPRYLRDTPRV
jgi:hypothetical protein